MMKRFGQNFLLSTKLREKIADAVQVEPGMKVWEIGPGLGSISILLLERGAKLTAFEIDHGFCRVLRETAFRDEPDFELVEGDALKTIPERRDIPERICGNLPYNVGTVLLGDLMEGPRRPSRMVFTLQKEVVQRLCSPVNGPDWSVISIVCQMDYDVKPLFDLKPGCFYPEPNVTSTAALFTRREQSRVEPKLKNTFLMVVHDLFSQRRKTIKNNLLSGKCGGRLLKGGVEAMIQESGLEPTRRAEELNWDELNALTASFARLSASDPSDNT